MKSIIFFVVSGVYTGLTIFMAFINITVAGIMALLAIVSILLYWYIQFDRQREGR